MRWVRKRDAGNSEVTLYKEYIILCTMTQRNMQGIQNGHPVLILKSVERIDPVLA